MTATIIKVDFRAKTHHRVETLEQMAAEIMAPWVDTATSELIPFGGAGIDGMSAVWAAPDKDPA
jgi:hypothetical protein